MTDPAPEQLRFPSSGLVPNNRRLPVLIWRDVLAPLGLAGHRAVLARLAASGWCGGWVNGIYPFHHYHARSHEVLAITSGHADVRLGGPGGHDVHVAAGDVVVLPAGTGHCRLRSSADLEVVGAYPSGQEDWDLKRETKAEFEAALAEIPVVPLPPSDPLFGRDGPLVRLWLTSI